MASKMSIPDVKNEMGTSSVIKLEESQLSLTIIPSLQSVFKTFIGPEILDQSIKTDATTMFVLKENAKLVASQCRIQVRGKKPVQEAAVTEEQWNQVKVLLVTLCHLATRESTTAEMIDRFIINGILAMFIRTENGLPYPIPDVSQLMKDKFQKISEGQTGISTTAIPSKQQTAELSKSTSISNRTNNHPSAAASTSNCDSNTPTDSSEVPTVAKDVAVKIKNKTKTDTEAQKAPIDHPIFGINGIMHHISIHQDLKKSYRVELGYKSVLGSVIGNNGFEVGAWFPRQHAMCRDGMHNLPQGGIAGTTTEGAYSVIIASSNTKGGKDIDNGTTIFYSSTIRTEAPLNPGSQTLTRSIETGKPIRVIRKSTCDFPNKPAVGFRYEGLYKAVSVEEKSEGEGKAKSFWSLFRLERIAGQVGFDLARPTLKERRDFQRIEEGY